MANWKLGKTQYSFTETATSGGTLTLTASSKQFQILTGSSNHTVQLPNATTAAAGVSYVIVNQSTGTITVNYNDTTLLTTVKAGQATELLLTSISTSNGVWSSVSASGSGGGIASVEPGALIDADYAVLAADNGRVLNVDTSGVSGIDAFVTMLMHFDTTFDDVIVPSRIYTNNGASITGTFKFGPGGALLSSGPTTNVTTPNTADFAFGTGDFTVDFWINCVNFGLSGLNRGVLGNTSGTSNRWSIKLNAGTNQYDFDVDGVGTIKSTSTSFNTSQWYHIEVTRVSGTLYMFVDGVMQGSGVASAHDFNQTSGTFYIGYHPSAPRDFPGYIDELRVSKGIGRHTSGFTPEVEAYGSAVPVTITLPAPTAGFNITVKDAVGNAFTNPITVERLSGTELIDQVGSDDIIDENYGSMSFVADGTDWHRAVSFNGNAPTPPPGKGLFGGGYTGVSSNVIQYVTIATTGNAIDFGDLTVARADIASCSSATRGLWAGSSAPSNVIDYVTIATLGNAVDFGDLLTSIGLLGGCASATRGLFGGGHTGPSNVIQYVTIATTGNAIDFGDLTVARYSMGACASPTRGLWAGGSPETNVIDYVTIATLGNAVDFGDLSVARTYLDGSSNSVRGVFGGGFTGPSNVIDYVTIATTGNAIDFGDLSVARWDIASCSNSIRVLFAGGDSGSLSNVIDYVTIATTGNATDFGDLLAANASLAGCSNSHGGL